MPTTTDPTGIYTTLMSMLEQKLTPADFDEASLLLTDLHDAYRSAAGELPPATAMDAIFRINERNHAMSPADRIAQTMGAIRRAEAETGLMAYDAVSPSDVYRQALTDMGVATQGVHPSAYPAMYQLARRRAVGGGAPRAAMDSATAKRFDERFPGATDIVVM